MGGCRRQRCHYPSLCHGELRLISNGFLSQPFPYCVLGVSCRFRLRAKIRHEQGSTDRMVTIPELKQQYESLDRQVEVREEAVIDTECLLTFEYEYPEQESEVSIDTDEFHRSLSLDWTAGLWNAPGRLRASILLYRAKVPQVLPALLSGRRYRARTRCQPHPSGPRSLLPAPQDESNLGLQNQGRSPYICIGRLPCHMRMTLVAQFGLV